MFPFSESISARKLGIRFVAAALILGLSGCTNIHNDSDRTRAEGGLAGAAGGAALGAGVGALAGGKNKTKSMMAGAAIGAAAGGLGGAAYGNAVAKKKEGYTRTEDALDAQLRSTRRQVSDLHTFNLGLKYEIARHQQTLASLSDTSHTTGRAVEQFELRSRVAARASELDRRARSWQETIDAHKAALKQFSGDPRSVALRTDIQDLSNEQRELRKARDEFRSIGHHAQ